MKTVSKDYILKRYFNKIDSDLLSQSNITFDENLHIEMSNIKYITYLGSFLKQLMDRKYIVSESILDKLLSIIDYTDYEVQILEKYIDIISKYIFTFNKNRLMSQDVAKDYVVSYSKYIKNNSILDDKKYIWIDDIDADEFFMGILANYQYYLTEAETSSLEFTADILQYLYKNDFTLFEELSNFNNNKLISLAILLDDNEENSWGYMNLLLYYIYSADNKFKKLAELINVYFEINGSYTLSNNVCNNINRLFNIITMRMKNDEIQDNLKNDISIWKKLVNKTKFNINIATVIYRYKHSVLDDLEYLIYAYYNNIDTLGYIIHNDIFYIIGIILTTDCEEFCLYYDEIYKMLEDLFDQDIINTQPNDILEICILEFANLGDDEIKEQISKLLFRLRYKSEIEYDDEWLKKLELSISD